VLALYTDNDEFKAHVAALTARRDGALIAYRSLAEMALCHAPMAGRTPGLSDIDTLAARCSRLVTTAYVSDACNRHLIEARVEFSANGSLELPLVPLYDLIGEYTQATLTHMFQEHAEAYDAYFATDPSILTSNNFTRLDDVVRAETGLSTPELVKYHYALDQTAYRFGNHVQCARLSELTATLKAIDDSITPEGIQKFFRSFALTHRPNWDRVPDEFERWEFEPWRFERRLSLNIRPIVIASTDSNPWVIYGVGQLHRALSYYFSLLDQGWWDPAMLVSSTAKDYVTERNNQLATQFEVSVFSVLKAHSFDGRQGI
jgi:hypothetical protein